MIRPINSHLDIPCELLVAGRTVAETQPINFSSSVGVAGNCFS